MKNFIGRIYKSNNCGEFTIIEEILDNTTKDRLFRIRFNNTGYETISSYSAIRHGRVKDKLLPSVANVGYIGNVRENITDPDIICFYKPWNDMINRCYNTNDKDYHLYGGLGITVDKRWFCFENFLYDAKLLPGYQYKKAYPNIYQLDKDYFQLNIPKSKRIYSNKTCAWISKYDNIMIMNREKPISSGFFGVLYSDGTYQTRINNIIYGRFSIPEAAANLFNYIYPLVKTKFNNIMILNDVNPIPYNELEKYAINKNIYVGSTTIPLIMGVEY